MLRPRQRRQIDVVLLQGPQQRSERAGCRFQQRRQVDVIGAEAHAVFSQGRAGRLVEVLHLGRDLRTFQHAQGLDQLEGDAARDPGDVAGLGEIEQRPEQFFNMRLQPQVEPRLHRIAWRAAQPFIRNDPDPRVQRVVRRHDSRHRIAGPANRTIGGQHELIIGRGRQLLGAGVDFAGQGLLRGCLQGLGVGAGLGRVGRKGESIEPADYMAFHDHFAGLADFRIQHGVFPQAAHQYTGTTINETLREPLMQRIGQFIFDLARDSLPIIGIRQPVRSVGNEGPGADLRDPARQGVNIAVGPIGLVDLGSEPGVWNSALLHQETI